MFGTLHWKSHNKEAEFVERPYGSLNLEKNLACDRCKARKVKCSANDEGCCRCKRIGKKCTFSSVKHRGDKRIRKASISVARQEHSFQPSDSSSSKDTGPEGRVCSDKQPLASSPPADGDVDYSERGQQLLAEFPTDILADIPSNFDLSFLAEFSRQTTDQDGDDISNLTLLPFPFFSTILSSTHPEPIQPAAVRTSEKIMTPPLCSGDEILHSSPPTRQFQDPSLFELGSNATPTSLHASTLVSTGVLLQSPSGQPCQCLATVIFAVEEFEASCSTGNRAELDSIVAYQKEAIKCCRSMLKCSSCTAKRENLVLLAFMTEKIVAACGRIVVLYRMKDGNTRTGSVQSSLLGCLPTDQLSHSVNVEGQDFTTSSASFSLKIDCTHAASIVSTHTGTSSDWRELLLGDYEISTPLEWEHLIRVLICLQLGALMKLLADMKNVSSKALGDAQTARLVQDEIRVSELEKEIYIISSE